MLAKGELKIIESQKRVEYRQRVRTSNGGYKWITVGKMVVLSSEAFSKHGYKPSCVIFDELHAQPNRELWEVMTFGAGSGRKQPVWIVLTTAGDDPDRKSIGWEIHEKAVGIRGESRQKAATSARSSPSAMWMRMTWKRRRRTFWSRTCPTGCRCSTA